MVANNADYQKWSAHHPFSNCSISPLTELISTPFEQCWNLTEAVLNLPYLQLPSHCSPFPSSEDSKLLIPSIEHFEVGETANRYTTQLHVSLSAFWPRDVLVASPIAISTSGGRLLHCSQYLILRHFQTSSHWPLYLWIWQ